MNYLPTTFEAKNVYDIHDKENDVYEIGGDKGNFEIHSGSVHIKSTDIISNVLHNGIISGSNTAGTINENDSSLK